MMNAVMAAKLKLIIPLIFYFLFFNNHIRKVPEMINNYKAKIVSNTFTKLSNRQLLDISIKQQYVRIIDQASLYMLAFGFIYFFYYGSNETFNSIQNVKASCEDFLLAICLLLFFVFILLIEKNILIPFKFKQIHYNPLNRLFQ